MLAASGHLTKLREREREGEAGSGREAASTLRTEVITFSWKSVVRSWLQWMRSMSQVREHLWDILVGRRPVATFIDVVY